LGKDEVEITFAPTKFQSLNTFINLSVKDGQGTVVKVVADVVAPKVSNLLKRAVPSELGMQPHPLPKFFSTKLVRYGQILLDLDKNKAKLGRDLGKIKILHLQDV